MQFLGTARPARVSEGAPESCEVRDRVRGSAHCVLGLIR
ncbi:hypothetical protein SEA_MILDRED21_104 [Streptomyces phage Mildred21]|uniref:Uncharacterized protein n=1 Tax=Streptomyces phage Mildred21 TaxID=2023959 RepID=A0A222YVF4_9CAUD|nr:hypothetical protein FDI35_gp171 [Streptomyces phage Mildred21]ASR75507.1 hypothetical protein SEA_MILDRED21_104 [Streptomyces phage Mildred21]